MLITEIAKKLNITPRTIRHYEEIGVIKANRLENNYRYFNTENINKLTKISKQIKELEDLKESLEWLVRKCPGNSKPECPILDELARE